MKGKREEGGVAATGSAFWPRPRPRTLFFGLLAWVAFSLAVSVIVAPPVYAVIADLVADPPHFRKVTRRVVQAAALAFGLFALRRLGVRGARDIGYGGFADTAPRFLRSAGLGLAFAASILAIDFASGARRWHAAPELASVALGVVGVALLAFVEEGCFRGALLFPFGRLAGAPLAAAAILNSALFATVHFVRGGMRGGGADASAALAMWSAVPAAVGDHFESWIGLFAIGLALDRVARRQGDAWGVTGLHFGGGLAVQLAGRTSDVEPGVSSLFFVDGLLPGYGFVAALAAVLLARRVASRRAAAAEV